MSRGALSRGVLGLLTYLLLVAPAPGNTGGCGGDTLDDAADFGAFCLESRSLRCLREQARGTLTDVQACVDDARDRCEAIAFWPESCEPAPRQRETEACLDELRRSDNLDQSLVTDEGPSNIGACRLCP